MSDKLDEFAAVFSELSNVLALMSTQLGVAQKMAAAELPRAMALFKRLNQLAEDIGIETSGLSVDRWEDAI